MKTIYIFSGLGVDERVFKQIIFPNSHVTFIRWILPIQNETIEKYASRILEQITCKKPILVGLSFGGMMAIEVAKLIETDKIILLGSAKTMYEIPGYFRFFGKLHLHNRFNAHKLSTRFKAH